METRSTEIPQEPTAGKPTPAPQLTIDQILAWADAHHRATGQWPTRRTGWVRGVGGLLTWRNVNIALRRRSRDLPGGLSLEKLLRERRGVIPGVREKPTKTRTELTVEAILAWADAHHQASGLWPSKRSGPIAAAPRWTWSLIDGALSHGRDGLPGGTTLRRLLLEHRGPQAAKTRPDLTVEQILAWAGFHYATAGRWPSADCGPVAGAPRENWRAISTCLRKGERGLPGGTTLRQLMRAHLGVPTRCLPHVTVEQVLAWADTYHETEGRWPHATSGRVTGNPRLTWFRINELLRRGGHGLPGGSSLRRLLKQNSRRDWRNRGNRLGALTVDLILGWADAHYETFGRWPNTSSGPVISAPSETWRIINNNLWLGQRSLPGGMRIAGLIREHRRDRNTLTMESITAWGEAYHAATCRWPRKSSGAVAFAPGVTWAGIDRALRLGHHELPGGSSLAKLFGRAPHRKRIRRPLSLDQIGAWADAHHAATGRWPTVGSGAIAGVPGDSWSNINQALTVGGRGLPAGTSLKKLLAGRAIPTAVGQGSVGQCRGGPRAE